MVDINLWIASTTLGIGGILLILQINTFQFFLDAYRYIRHRQLKLISISFLLFILATSTLLAISLYISIQYDYLGIRGSLILRRMAILIYNIIFALALLIILLSTTRGTIYTFESLIPPLILASLSNAEKAITEEFYTSLDQLVTYGMIATDIIILIEASFLLSLYLIYSERELLMGKMWTLGILLIIFSRGIDLIPMKPFSELILVSMDLTTFLLIYLMKKEAEIKIIK